MDKLEVAWHSDERTLRAEVFPFGLGDEGWHISIQVSRHNDFDASDANSARPATVNWSALGSQPQDIARRFGEGLAVAAGIAAQMNQTIYVYDVSGIFEDEQTHERKPFARLILGNNLKQVRASVHSKVDHVVAKRTEFAHEASEQKERPTC